MLLTKDNILLDEKKYENSFQILCSGNFDFDDKLIKAVILSGSRGPSNSYRNDSDIDISLIVNEDQIMDPFMYEPEFKSILNHLLRSWKHEVVLDTALLFPVKNCAFECFFKKTANISCTNQELDCFGVFKIQKKFEGFVPKMGLDVNKVMPIEVLWKK